MPAHALARADRLATAAVVLLRRGEKRGDRTRVLHDTLMEFRELLVHVRSPLRYRLLEFGVGLAVVVAALAAGTALHAYDLPWAVIPAAALIAGVLVGLKGRPFPLSPPGIDAEGVEEGNVEALVDEIGVELARAAGPSGFGGRFAHLQACYARAWDLVHWGPLPVYTPGRAAEYGRKSSGEFGEWLAPFWTPAACAHVMVHQYWHLSLRDLAARQRLARCDHALRYLLPMPNANGVVAARVFCALVPLAVTTFFGAFFGALSAVLVIVPATGYLLDSCKDYPSTRFRRENITGDDLYTRRHFAACPDPLLRELLGR